MIFSFMIASVVNMHLLIYIGCAGSSSLKDHQISARLDMNDFHFFSSWNCHYSFWGRLSSKGFCDVLILQCLVINVQRNFCSCQVGVVHVPGVTLCWSYPCLFVIMINRLCCWNLFTWLVCEIVSCVCRILKPRLNHKLNYNFVPARSNAESIDDDQTKVEKLSLKKKGIES